MGLVPSRLRDCIASSGTAAAEKRDTQSKVLIPLSIASRSASSKASRTRLTPDEATLGLAHLPAELVDHIASFLPFIDTLQFAATNTSTRDTIALRTLIAALRMQATRVKNPEHFFALFEQIATLPPALRQHPLGALARSIPQHGEPWQSARTALLEACVDLPPEHRAAPLIALAGTICTSGPPDNWQSNLDHILALISTLPVLRFQAAALCALANTDGLGLMRTTTAFDSVLEAAQRLPERLCAQVLKQLAPGIRYIDISQRDTRAMALLAAGTALTPAQRFAGLSTLPEISRGLSKDSAATLLQGLCDATQEMPLDEQDQVLFEIASNLSYSITSDRLIPLFLWLSNTVIERQSKYRPSIQKELFLNVCYFEKSKQKHIFEAICRDSALLPASERRSLIFALQTKLMGQSVSSKVIRSRIGPDALEAVKTGIRMLESSLKEHQEKRSPV